MGVKKLSERIMSVVLLISGVALWVRAQAIDAGTTMGQGSDFMPRICATMWVILAAILVLQAMKMPSGTDKELDINMKGYLLTLVYLFAYIALLNIVGFSIASILYIFAQMMLYVPDDARTKRNIIIFVVLAVVIPIAVEQLFANVFSLLLPTGILF